MAGNFKKKLEIEKLKKQDFTFGPRRGVMLDIEDVLSTDDYDIPQGELENWEKYDLIYRTLCAVLYNFVPQSGHPGGSISSGRFVAGLAFKNLDYSFSDPNCKEADILSYAAGHKALGLYATWALRNEVMRIGKPEKLPAQNLQLRLEDLLGFRRNPTQETELFKKFKAKPLDGHPSPSTPFVKLSTGASGVGVAASVGLAFGALDTYSDNPPRVHIVEGECGMTPGRVHETLAIAPTAQIWNVVMHVDWNQASIDSNHVCRDGDKAGDYVQWNPVELGYLHDWNVILVKDGINFKKILAAQELALNIGNKQPTMIVYRTIKGWKYGIEGRKSHGAGHKFCSEEYYKALSEFETAFKATFPKFSGDKSSANIEKNFYDSLMVIRGVMEKEKGMIEQLSGSIVSAEARLTKHGRKPRSDAPDLKKLYASGAVAPEKVPENLKLKIGDSTTLRGELGKVLNHLNKLTNGALIASAADLFDSTSISAIGAGFGDGFYNYASNSKSRLMATGGICEDAMGAFMAGLSAFGNHIGASSSYGAFIAALEHIAARLHGIGQQTKKEVTSEPYHPWILINAHAGVKTGEDGPTHADPQALQILQENFPRGVLITLTPWDPAEMWPLVTHALLKRPAVLSPFVTRPNETIIDRAKLKIAPIEKCVTGIYALRHADEKAKQYHGTVVLQGSEVAISFLTEVLPKLDEAGINMNVYYVASAELFDLLPEKEQEKIFPAKHAKEAMGISGFTLPTMYKWIMCEEGRKLTLYPHKGGHYLGSGSAQKVLEEAGLDGKTQLKVVMEYAKNFEKRNSK